MNANIRAAGFGLLGYALYAVHDLIVKLVGSSYGTVQILFFALLFAFPLVSLMMVHDLTEANLRPRHPWWSTLRVVALLGSALCGFYAFATLPLAQAYAMLFAMPLFVTLLSVPVLGERIGWYRGAAVVIGLAGVLVVLRPGGSAVGLGHAAALAAAISASVAAIVVRRIGRDERNVVLLLLPMLGSLIVISVLMPFHYRPMPIGDLGAMALISLLGFVALNCLIAAYKAGEAIVVSAMQYSQVVWAALFGYLIFDDWPDGYTIAGASLVIASGLVILFRERHGNVSRTTPVLRSRGRVIAGPNIRISPSDLPTQPELAARGVPRDP